MPIIRNS